MVPISPGERDVAIAELDLSGEVLFGPNLSLRCGDGEFPFVLADVDDDGDETYVWLLIDVPEALDPVTRCAVAVLSAVPVVSAIRLARGD